MARVYLDHNATAPLRPEVRDAIPGWLGRLGNPSSVHAEGRGARRLVEEARAQVAALAGAKPERVVFTASGTEANNLALRGFPDRRLLVSAVEHASVLAARPDAELLPVDGLGRVDPAVLAAALAGDPRPALVSIMAANNETGVLQPVSELAAAARGTGALFHCDAVQMPGRLPMPGGWDLLTLSAHKLGGLTGAGALVLAGADPAALVRGGGQERGRRAGTEGVLAIAAFGLAASLVEAEGFPDLRAALESTLVANGGKILGAGAERLPNTVCVALPGVAAETQLMALDLAGFAISSGSACSSGKVGRSHVLAAMGVGPDLAGSAIRVSFGRLTTAQDLTRFAAAWIGLARKAA